MGKGKDVEWGEGRRCSKTPRSLVFWFLGAKVLPSAERGKSGGKAASLQIEVMSSTPGILVWYLSHIHVEMSVGSRIYLYHTQNKVWDRNRNRNLEVFGKAIRAEEVI